MYIECRPHTIEVISSGHDFKWSYGCKGHMDATKHWKKFVYIYVHTRTCICLVFAMFGVCDTAECGWCLELRIGIKN